VGREFQRPEDQNALLWIKGRGIYFCSFVNPAELNFFKSQNKYNKYIKELNVAFRMLAAIILLSDVEFQRIENTRNEIIFVKNEAVLVKVAELLCVNPELLTSYLISTQINSSSINIK
jgi:hypothetical protein